MVNIVHVVSCHQINEVKEGVLLDGVGNIGVYTLGGVDCSVSTWATYSTINHGTVNER